MTHPPSPRAPARLIAEPDRRRFSGGPPQAKIASARDGIARRLDAPSPKLHEPAEIGQNLRMNDALAVGRWLKFENPTPEMQKDLGALLRHFTPLLRGPYVLDDGLRVAKKGMRDIALQGMRIAG